MRLRRAAVLAALFICCTARIALGQDVTLTARDGGIELSGRLLGFDGEFYRVETVYGELTIDGAGVTCSGAPCPDLKAFVAEISVSGAAAMGSVMMPALVEAFARQRGYDASRDLIDASHYTYTLRDPEDGRVVAIFRFRVTTTGEGFADLLANEADIVMALRSIRPTEAARAADAGLGNLTAPDRHMVLALDALVPVVAPGNPVRAISTGDLARMFAGEITKWSEPGGPVVLYAPATDGGTGQAIAERIMAPAGLDFARDVRTYGREDDMVAAVAEDPSGLGLGRHTARGNTRAPGLSVGCGLPLAANRQTIKTADYPLVMPLYLYQPARRLPKLARAFLSFVREPAAQLIIRRAGFVDQAIEEIPVDAQGSRFAAAILSAGRETTLAELQRMTGALLPMQRLTTTFRRAPDGSGPDAQSRANLRRLALALESGRFDGRQLVIAGFSAGAGPALANRSVALRDAEALRDAVLELAPRMNRERVTLKVEAFSGAMPIVCDGSAEAGAVNRRVEVWVR